MQGRFDWVALLWGVSICFKTKKGILKYILTEEMTRHTMQFNHFHNLCLTHARRWTKIVIHIYIVFICVQITTTIVEKY